MQTVGCNLKVDVHSQQTDSILHACESTRFWLLYAALVHIFLLFDISCRPMLLNWCALRFSQAIWLWKIFAQFYI